MSLLPGLTRVFATSEETERAQRLSEALSGLVPHRTLSVLMRSCQRAPVGAYGEDADGITASDLEKLGSVAGGTPYWQGEADVAGVTRPVVVVAESEQPGPPAAVLLLVRGDPTPVDDDSLGVLSQVWSLFTTATGQSLASSTVVDLGSSRAAAAERVRVTRELADRHRTALTSILGALRARQLDDRAARQTAIDLAAAALVELRTSVALERELGDERLDSAFERLRDELRPLVRYSTVKLEFAALPGDYPSGSDTRTISVPATTAQAARTISRDSVLTLLEQPDVARIRVAWTVPDGLEISVRDDGPGRDECSTTDLVERARALDGSFTVDRVPGWGTNLIAYLPLDHPSATGISTTDDPLSALRPRELEILAELAEGRRNREIAQKLSISENTVKFHVANLLDKLDVRSRNQAAILAHEAGLRTRPRPRAG